jgi:Skp family chaperone for outer membrane proteins
MKSILIIAAASALAFSAPSRAQQPAAAATPACYIEIQKLMADPPQGVGELGAAIRELDTKLRPQVEEVGRLKRLVEAIEKQQQQAEPPAGEGDEARPAAPATADQTKLADDLHRATTDLDAKQAQLKLDYAAQMQAIVGPVQKRVGQSAQAFGKEHGCTSLKMARAPDLAALQAAGAHNLTGEFVAWYAESKT